MKRLAAVALAVVLALCAAFAHAQATRPVQVTLGVVTLADDPRHAPRRMEKAYPGHPTGRAIDGVQLAAEDSAFELDAAGITLEVKDVVLPNAAGLTKALAEMGRRDGVRVNGINPGIVETARVQGRIERKMGERGVTREGARAAIVADMGVTRIGRPQDVADLVAFLVSPAADYIHGALIDIDGGLTKSI